MKLWKRDALEVTDGEGALLDGLAGLATQAIVEIGSYRGRSTCFLARGSHLGSGAPVYAVDLWTDGPGYAVVAPGSRLERPYAEPSTRMAFDVAIAEHGHGLVTPLQGHSLDIAATFTDPIGLLFIDGSHATLDVLADIAAWCGKLVAGGVVAFHDYSEEVVRAAVRQTLDMDPAWVHTESVERIGVYQRFPL
jgi:MMP 1-O-methyltransferase